jgi:hypothetical protein
MDIHFYVTMSDLERYRKEGVCYVMTDKECTDDDTFHISFSIDNHAIEEEPNDPGYYILRKII